MNNFKQNEELSLDVLNSLKKDSKISQRLLALKLNVSLGTLNYCLRELIKKGERIYIFQQVLIKQLILAKNTLQFF